TSGVGTRWVLRPPGTSTSPALPATDFRASRDRQVRLNAVTRCNRLIHHSLSCKVAKSGSKAVHHLCAFTGKYGVVENAIAIDVTRTVGQATTVRICVEEVLVSSGQR